MRPKVFCVGYAKTGTTSVQAALRGLGYAIGDEAEAGALIEDWALRDFRRIVRFCESADAFTDIPFSLPYTFQALDSAFPGSKFILTERGSAEDWYLSLVNFHKMLLDVSHTPTVDELKRFPLVSEGWIWRLMTVVAGATEAAPYDKERMIRLYEAHNRHVLDYFKHRPDDLLVLDVGAPNAMEGFCRFLCVDRPEFAMPHIRSRMIADAVRAMLGLETRQGEG